MSTTEEISVEQVKSEAWERLVNQVAVDDHERSGAFALMLGYLQSSVPTETWLRACDVASETMRVDDVGGRAMRALRTGDRVEVVAGALGAREGVVVSVCPSWSTGEPIAQVEVEAPVLWAEPNGPTRRVALPFAEHELRLLAQAVSS